MPDCNKITRTGSGRGNGGSAGDRQYFLMDKDSVRNSVTGVAGDRRALRH